MSYKWPGIPNGDYSFDHGRAVWNKIINYLRRLSEKLDSDIVDATADRRGMMTAADKDKLDGVEPGAEVNQNAFSAVKVGSSTIEADGKTDTLELAAGNAITLTPDTVNDKVTIGVTPDTYAIKSADLVDDPLVFERYSPSGRRVKIEIDEEDIGESADFGWDISDKDGAILALRSSAYETLGGAAQHGWFLLTARDADNMTQLVGRPNGGLTWNGYRVITTADTATTTAAGAMSAADKSKLDGISSGAEVNQNAFSNVKVGSDTIAADSKTDTLELVAGTGITLTPDANNDKVTVKVTDNTYAPASHSHAYLPLSGGTVTGGVNFADSTWNKVGNDAQFGDANSAGAICIQGINGTTGILFMKKEDASVNNSLRYDGTFTLGNALNIQGQLSAEGDLYVGKEGVSEGGQIILRKGTSGGLIQLDNYYGAFRIVSSNVYTLDMSTGEWSGIISAGTKRLRLDNTHADDLSYQECGTVCHVEGTNHNNTPFSYSVAHDGTSVSFGRSNDKLQGNWTRGFWLYGRWARSPGLYYGHRATQNNTSGISWYKVGFIGYNCPPQPTNSNGVGYWTVIDLNGESYTLPSGGTWIYYIHGKNASNAPWGARSGIAAGASTITIGSATHLYGFIFRIA